MNDIQKSPLPEGLQLYVPSGRVHRVQAIKAGLWGVAWAVGLGCTYGTVVAPQWHPAVQLAAAVLAGLLAAALTSLLCQSAHSRSVRFNRCYGLAFLLILVSARWVTALIDAVGAEGTWSLLSRAPWALPWALVSLAQSWGQLPHAAAGPLGLGLTWAAETLVLAGFVVGLAPMTTQTPYSEQTGAWAKEVFKGELLYPGISQPAWQQCWQRDGIGCLLQGLVASAYQHPASSQWWTLQVKGLAVLEDPAGRWLSLTLFTLEREDSGKVKRCTDWMCEAIAISDADFKAVQSHFNPSESLDGEKAESTTHDHDRSQLTARRPDPVELQPALSALRAENHALALSLAKAHCLHPDTTVRADAHRICALALCRLERWSEACEQWHALYELEPSAFNAMQMATSSVMAAELLRGQAWFDKADAENLRTREFSPALLRTQMLSALEQTGELAACVPHIDWMANMYGSVRITDSHLLWTHDLPFFGTFLDKALPILHTAMDKEDLRRWCERLRERVDENGQQELDARLAQL
ncbi:hypothetical protein [Caldimonas sp.]|uniref:hypothetical protein n=1 Tax=Caldimonas sp. TaxID=2838790 RepID=UPI00307D87C4